MQLLETSGWDDYELLDTGDGYRLERFGKYRLKRPDPQIIWSRSLSEKEWESVDAAFEKDANGRERWLYKNAVPNRWLLRYKNLSFWAELAPFKHTGVFPEQSLQWDFVQEKISQEKRELNVLNLFAYTGIASLATSQAGARVTHVDASRPTIGWAKENQKASHLEDKPIRWILDDVMTFVGREIKRNVHYDGIIMDPPVYGHGPHGEKWDFATSFPQLLKLCSEVLTPNPVFLLINAYAISASSLMLENVLQDFRKNFGGKVVAGELVLKEKSEGRLLSTGIYGRWSAR